VGRSGKSSAHAIFRAVYYYDLGYLLCCGMISWDHKKRRSKLKSAKVIEAKLFAASWLKGPNSIGQDTIRRFRPHFRRKNLVRTTRVAHADLIGRRFIKNLILGIIERWGLFLKNINANANNYPLEDGGGLLRTFRAPSCCDEYVQKPIDKQSETAARRRRPQNGNYFHPNEEPFE
jgi:hypothetical protein